MGRKFASAIPPKLIVANPLITAFTQAVRAVLITSSRLSSAGSEVFFTHTLLPSSQHRQLSLRRYKHATLFVIAFIVLYHSCSDNVNIFLQKKVPFLSNSTFNYFNSYTSSRIAIGAASPRRGPSLIILVYPPFLSAYFGAISAKSFVTTSSFVMNSNA